MYIISTLNKFFYFLTFCFLVGTTIKGGSFQRSTDRGWYTNSVRYQRISEKSTAVEVFGTSAYRQSSKNQPCDWLNILQRFQIIYKYIDILRDTLYIDVFDRTAYSIPNSCIGSRRSEITSTWEGNVDLKAIGTYLLLPDEKRRKYGAIVTGSKEKHGWSWEVIFMHLFPTCLKRHHFECSENVSIVEWKNLNPHMEFFF